MRATIDRKGMMHVWPETPLEEYALVMWRNGSELRSKAMAALPLAVYAKEGDYTPEDMAKGICHPHFGPDDGDEPEALVLDAAELEKGLRADGAL